MNDGPDSNELPRLDPPLWSMGLAVIVVLAAPLIIYSLAPSGPLRAGDTVFSEGQQEVFIAPLEPPAEAQTLTTCLLDPNNPLIILEISLERPDGNILATVQGSPHSEWPFCPSHTHIQVSAHQIVQKSDPWEGPKRALAWLGGG